MITVITPTYNRAYILGKLWISLKNQSSREFEWLVIDDGSTDKTAELVQTWISQDNGFHIRYYCKENGGKHRALNFGVPLAKGEFVFIVDSDDTLTNDAIECVTQWIQTIKNKKWIAGVAGLRGYPDGRRIGDFPNRIQWVDVKNTHRYTHHLDGDKAEIYRKDLLMQHPFPEFPGEKFIGEGAVWNQLALEGYKVRWMNKVIYVGNYLEDGLTRDQKNLLRKNFRGYTYNTKLNYRSIVFPYNLMAVAVFIGFAYEMGYTDQWIRNELGIGKIDFVLCRLLRIVRKMK